MKNNKGWEKHGYKTYVYLDKDNTEYKFLARSDEDAVLYRKKWDDEESKRITT
tara:strand:- start:354 stop:512 length:159 start_codon:yes stop_codon:yes gene_type:complete